MARSKSKEGAPGGGFLATISENVPPYEMVLEGQHHVNNSQKPVELCSLEILVIPYAGAAAHPPVGRQAASSFPVWKKLSSPDSQ